jgi:hypothetical protein
MWVLLAAALGARCSPDVYAVCKSGYGTAEVQYEEIENYSDCLQCNADNCSAPLPASRTRCYPLKHACAVCGTPTVATQIGPAHTLTVQPSCESSRTCPGTVVFDAPVTFVRSNGLAIKGQAAVQSVLARTCPLFVFDGAVRVTISGLEITCETSSSDTAAAVVFRNTAVLALSYGVANAVRLHGVCRTGVLVDGGVPKQALMAVDMSGSHIGAVRVSKSVYRQTYDVVLVNYYGTVSALTAPQHTRFVLQPSEAPDGTVFPALTYIATQLLSIQNFAEYTNIFGRKYEIAYHNKDAYGWSSDPGEASSRDLMGMLSAALVALGIVLLFLLNDLHDLHGLTKGARLVADKRPTGPRNNPPRYDESEPDYGL